MILYNTTSFTVLKLSLRRCNCYALSNGIHTVLVDTSVRGERKKLIRQLNKAGIKKLSGLVITHAHTDHASNARFIQRVYQCPVFVSEPGINLLTKGFSTLPKGTNKLTRMFISRFQGVNWLWKRLEPCEDVEPLTTEALFPIFQEQAKVLLTPGHTLDSASILINDEVAIVGDAMVNYRGKIYPPFADDEIALIKSWRILLNTQCKVFYPAHGKAVSKELLFMTYKKLTRRIKPGRF